MMRKQKGDAPAMLMGNVLEIREFLSAIPLQFVRAPAILARNQHCGFQIRHQRKGLS